VVPSDTSRTAGGSPGSVEGMPSPACLITGSLSHYRRLPFQLLAEAEDVEIITWDEHRPTLPGVHVCGSTQAGAVRRIAQGDYRAVICGLGGRFVLPGTYLAAQQRRIPFILWATIWSHPRTPFHALSYLPARHLYRNADAVVTYGSHVSAYVRRYRNRGKIFEAPQAVDVELFSEKVTAPERLDVRRALSVGDEQILVLYVGRLEREKGVDVLLQAWLPIAAEGNAVLALVGSGPLDALIDHTPATRRVGPVANHDLPPWYAAADVVVIPSIRTRTFVEPWALVVNEAMLQARAVIATDAVGAVAGGLVRHGETGIVIPAADRGALSAAIQLVADDPDLRVRLGTAARLAASAHTPEAWVEGVAAALEAVNASISSRPPNTP
jgi:glycosyltransferase involved in cell wall biosynthesis